MAKKLSPKIFAMNKVNILVVDLSGDAMIQLKGPDGEPISGAQYIIRKINGEEITGYLDDKGFAKVESNELEGASVEFSAGKALSEEASLALANAVEK